MSINILTERQRCRLRCATTHWKMDNISPSFGDARQCEHGRWWVATGQEAEDRYYRTLDLWRPVTWTEKRRAVKGQR